MDMHRVRNMHMAVVAARTFQPSQFKHYTFFGSFFVDVLVASIASL